MSRLRFTSLTYIFFLNAFPKYALQNCVHSTWHVQLTIYVHKSNCETTSNENQVLWGGRKCRKKKFTRSHTWIDWECC